MESDMPPHLRPRGEDGYLEPYSNPENWGERPPITREDVLLVANDIWSKGNTEMANNLIDSFDEGDHWVDEAVWRYLKIMGQ